MKLTAATAIFSLFAAASAAGPSSNDITVKEASSKCGSQAQLSCCNDVDYVGDTKTIQQGVASGILSGLLGQGSGAQGIGAFTGCSKLNVAGEYILFFFFQLLLQTLLTCIAAVVGVQDILNKECQQNIACCDTSGAEAVRSLCPLWTIYANDDFRTATLLALPFPALLLAPLLRFSLGNRGLTRRKQSWRKMVKHG